MNKLVITLFILIIAATAHSQASWIYIGTPIVKISEGGWERLPETLTREKAAEVKCIISKHDGKYYWFTRDHIELIPIVSGPFVTFMSVTGTGYVRIVRSDFPEFKERASLMTKTEEKYDYVEHMLFGLHSVTYYGVEEKKPKPEKDGKKPLKEESLNE